MFPVRTYSAPSATVRLHLSLAFVCRRWVLVTTSPGNSVSHARRCPARSTLATADRPASSLSVA
ncbi:hypothetical protein ACFQH8_01810 [Halomicroarcula sp. GCM10025710]